MVLAQDTHQMRQVAGSWLNVWGWINMVFYLAYMFYALFDLRDAAHLQINERIND